MSAIIFPDRDFGDGWGWSDEGPIREAARFGLRVVVRPELPFESLDPERPGWVHAVHIKPPTSTETRDGFGFSLEFLRMPEVLIVSRQLFDALKKHARSS